VPEIHPDHLDRHVGVASGKLADAAGPTSWLSLGAWGWHNEAGIHVLRLILSGAFEKFPGLQVISGHWGEMVPFYLQRLDDTLPPKTTGVRLHACGRSPTRRCHDPVMTVDVRRAA
jgi:predicted TIM-barrel fold metal-dependent hydrolase